MEDNSKLKKQTVTSAGTKLMEKIITLGLQLLISIVLARMLAPDDYGIIALINVFIALSNVFVESGFGVGLIQKKEIFDIDVNTIFWSCISSSLIVYLIIFGIAPFVSSFYDMPIVCSVLRVYALTIIIGSMTSVPNSIVSRRLQYSKQLIPTILATVISGAFGIFLAYNGFGVWALVFQQLTQRVIYLFVIELLVRYVPKFEFSFNSFRLIFGFTWKIVIARLLNTFFNEVRSLIIGKRYNSEQLGFFNKGNQFPATIATASDYSLQSVMFSVYSKKQDDIVLLKSMVRRTMKLSSYILFPMMFGLIVVSEPLVLIVLTDKWLPAVPFMRIACLACALQPINTANGQAVNALGRSDVTLKCEIIKRAFAIVSIIGAVFINVNAIAWTMVVVSLVGNIEYFIVNGKLLKYGLKEQLLDLLPALLLSIVMSGIVYSIVFLKLGNWLTIILQVIVGIVIYIGGSMVFKIESFEYGIDIIKGLMRKNK